MVTRAGFLSELAKLNQYEVGHGPWLAAHDSIMAEFDRLVLRSRKAEDRIKHIRALEDEYQVPDTKRYVVFDDDAPQPEAKTPAAALEDIRNNIIEDLTARRDDLSRQLAYAEEKLKYHEDMANEACQRLDARVRELLAANTAEVERRRELQAEMERMQDLIKHLCLAIASK